MKLLVRTFVAFLAIFFLGVSHSRAQGFPDGPGKDVVQAACSVCHETELITNARRSKAEWTETVQDMVSRGAPLVEGEREIVIEYLSKNFGSDKAQRERTPDRPNPNRPDKRKEPVYSAANKK